MKKRLISFYSIIALSFIFTSCKNDLEVLSPGKEMVSVYGLLDPTQPVQNIRINKVYVNEKDALISAQDADAINYGPGELTVFLERYVNGVRSAANKPNAAFPTAMNIIVLTETVVTTQSGTFNQTQRIWQTNAKLHRDGEYKLTITKTATGEEIANAQNVIIDSLSSAASNSMPFMYIPSNPSAYPNHGQYIITGTSPTPTSRYIDYSVLSATQNIKFKTIKNAKIYDVVMRFHYADSLTTSSTPDLHYVDFSFNSQKGNISKIDEVLSVSFVANDFYLNLDREISKMTPSNLKNRKALYMEYIVYAGAESVSDFLEVNAPSTTIATDKPYYTNINGGVGIFSSRSSSSVTKDLIAGFVDKIACHPSTFHLLFCDFTNGKPKSSPCP